MIPDEFWSAEERALYDELYPLLLAAALEAAEQALAGVGMAVDWALVNIGVRRWASEYTYDLVKGITGTTRTFLQEALRDWIDSGAPLDTLAGVLEPMFGPIRAEMIAVTEVTRAFAQGNIETWRASGFVTEQRWMTVEDGHVCTTICAPLDGKTFPLGDPAHTPPGHVNCLPGNTLVLPVGGVTAGSERWYEGDVIVIETLVNQLTVTPNHPILTHSGWRAAGQLMQGEDVWCYGRSNWEALRNENNQHGIASIEDVFGTLGLVEFRMPVAPPDFHGDGAGSDVAAIRPNSEIMDNRQTQVREPSAQRFFTGRDVIPEIALPFSGSSAQFGEGNHPAPSSVMSGFHLSGALSAGHARPLQRLGLGWIAGANPGFMQALAKGAPVDTSLAGELILGLASEVTLQKIVKIRKEYFTGHVYNLQTASGLFVAAGIVTHNCRCYLQPVVAR